MANPILEHLRLSGTTYDLVDSTAIHNLDGYYTSGQTNDAITAATNALAESIAEQGYQTSTDVQNAISGKADTTAVTQEISAAVSGKADTTAVTADIAAAVSGKVDNSTYTAYTAATDSTLGNKADKSEIPSVSGYADSVKYNSTSKYVEFYHGGTGGTKVFEYDASPFLIDGMVQNVEIKDVTISGESVTCLVISFNTDAGKQDINIPISQIFDASNYYTKTETDNAIAQAIVEASGVTSGVVQSMIDSSISGKADSSAVTQEISAAVSGKADTTAVTAVNNALTAHTADTTIHVTSSDKTTWSGKQDALVSGTNIKTVNGESILGSGNITVQTLPTVQGTTLIFS